MKSKRVDRVWDEMERLVDESLSGSPVGLVTDLFDELGLTIDEVQEISLRAYREKFSPQVGLISEEKNVAMAIGCTFMLAAIALRLKEKANADSDTR